MLVPTLILISPPYLTLHFVFTSHGYFLICLFIHSSNTESLSRTRHCTRHWKPWISILHNSLQSAQIHKGSLHRTLGPGQCYRRGDMLSSIPDWLELARVFSLQDSWAIDAIDGTQLGSMFSVMERMGLTSQTFPFNSQFDVGGVSYSSGSFSSSDSKMRRIIVCPQSCDEDPLILCLWKCFINCKERWWWLPASEEKVWPQTSLLTNEL